MASQELCKHAAYRPIRDYMACERAKGAVATLEALSRGEGPAAVASGERDPSKPVQLRRLTLADFMEAIKVRTRPRHAICLPGSWRIPVPVELCSAVRNSERV